VVPCTASARTVQHVATLPAIVEVKSIEERAELLPGSIGTASFTLEGLLKLPELSGLEHTYLSFS
jgi:hypothetical protein